MDDLLLHACCGPCSTVSVPAWRSAGCEPTLLFVNPNIHPAAELERRLVSLERFADVADVELVADARLGPADWLAALGEGEKDVLAVAADDERRCAACLRLRLYETALQAAQRALPRFSTTLSVSPYQRHDLIRQAGEQAAAEWGVKFLYRDLRPQFRRSYDESRRLGLYRQRYCGCAVSKWRAWEERGAARAHRLVAARAR
jgi:predicted adenine nucleotide alpha hydrolase (AANH) superfamily ATPase